MTTHTIHLAACHLGDEQVEEVREMRRRGIQQRKVAEMYGVSQSTVWRMTHRKVRT